MAKRKRGRPKLADHERRSEPVGIRLTKQVRDQLESARRSPDGDRTMSQEIEMRLRQSFDTEGEIRKRFGSASTYGLLRMMARGIEALQWHCQASPEAEEKLWIDDAPAFEQVTMMINAMLEYFRPRKRRVVPKRFRPASHIGREVAAMIVANLEYFGPNADPEDVTYAVAGAAPALHRRIRKSALKDWPHLGPPWAGPPPRGRPYRAPSTRQKGK